MGRRILVVDDSPYARSSLKSLLEANGHRVAGEASTPVEALEAYKRLKPEAVTMDIVMPEGGGLEAIKALRALDPAARIVVVSALRQDAVLSEARQLGVAAFVQKPVKWKELEAALEGALR